MTDLPSLHSKALDGFGRRVNAVRDDQWTAPTPCTGWDVRVLVNHVVVEQLWSVPLLAGATIEEVGERFEGDQLGAHPVRAWDDAARATREAWAAPSAWERTVHLSMGDTPAEEYGFQLTADLFIHGWDLARATGGDETSEPELVHMFYERMLPQADAWRSAGAFGPSVQVPEDADELTRLLALTGRRA